MSQHLTPERLFYVAVIAVVLALLAARIWGGRRPHDEQTRQLQSLLAALGFRLQNQHPALSLLQLRQFSTCRTGLRPIELVAGCYRGHYQGAGITLYDGFSTRGGQMRHLIAIFESEAPDFVLYPTALVVRLGQSRALMQGAWGDEGFQRHYTLLGQAAEVEAHFTATRQQVLLQWQPQGWCESAAHKLLYDQPWLAKQTVTRTEIEQFLDDACRLQNSLSTP